MDRLISTASWYNPLSVLVNHGWREIEDIVFYRKTGEEYHVGRGWFGGNSNLKEGEFIDVPSVSLRRKIRFDGEAFAVSVKKSCLGEKKKRMVLYLPFEFFEFESERVESKHGEKIEHFEKFVSKRDPRVFFQHKAGTSIDEERRGELRKLRLRKERLERSLKKVEKEISVLEFGP